VSGQQGLRLDPLFSFLLLRAAQSGPPERPGPPQRAQLMPSTKVSLGCQREGDSPWALEVGIEGFRLRPALPRVNQRSQDQPLPPPNPRHGCRQKSAGAWSGRASPPRGGSAELFQLATLVALKGGSIHPLHSDQCRGQGRGVLRRAFSVPGPDKAQDPCVEGLVSTLGLSPVSDGRSMWR
jgi:hypothetical protein